MYARRPVGEEGAIAYEDIVSTKITKMRPPKMLDASQLYIFGILYKQTKQKRLKLHNLYKSYVSFFKFFLFI